MTHNSITHDHTVRRGLLFFGLTFSATAWTIFVVWLLFIQLMRIVRG